MKEILRKKIKEEKRRKNIINGTFKRGKPVLNPRRPLIILLKTEIPQNISLNNLDLLLYLVHNNTFYINNMLASPNKNCSDIDINLKTTLLRK